ncbi:uncharacterized protein [Miscanthus floridulus]|uniref:uncharacterized protein n=1 Tax=Miscanthus floridulus TaxID=154761 RepID=UPI003458F25A
MLRRPPPPRLLHRPPVSPRRRRGRDERRRAVARFSSSSSPSPSPSRSPPPPRTRGARTRRRSRAAPLPIALAVPLGACAGGWARRGLQRGPLPSRSALTLMLVRALLVGLGEYPSSPCGVEDGARAEMAAGAVEHLTQLLAHHDDKILEYVSSNNCRQLGFWDEVREVWIVTIASYFCTSIATGSQGWRLRASSQLAAPLAPTSGTLQSSSKVQRGRVLQ